MTFTVTEPTFTKERPCTVIRLIRELSKMPPNYEIGVAVDPNSVASITDIDCDYDGDGTPYLLIILTAD